MRVLLLSPYPWRISGIIAQTDDVHATADLPADILDYDFIVSYGLRHIIRNEAVFKKYKNNIINLHIGYLPWNRGADPVYWALREDTPLGVTIHVMTKGLDMGPIIAQQLIKSQRPSHLDVTRVGRLKKIHYNRVRKLFQEKWPIIRTGEFPVREQPRDGTYHTVQNRIDDELRQAGEA